MKYLIIFLLIGIIGGYLVYRKITSVLSKINRYFNESQNISNVSNQTEVNTKEEVIYKDEKVEVLVGEAKRKK
ncbi:MAG TPA: hypothetical protein PL149_03295 [Candidatus Kapabacteria bacterium]|jgi:hypothetical protein|nr:hypothetical protein [Candidatus Kapabacteria bacterium]HPU23166.1 hypothetical protein [Candidatus Kapabacteria bacterium]